MHKQTNKWRKFNEVIYTDWKWSADDLDGKFPFPSTQSVSSNKLVCWSPLSADAMFVCLSIIYVRRRGIDMGIFSVCCSFIRTRIDGGDMASTRLDPILSISPVYRYETQNLREMCASRIQYRTQLTQLPLAHICNFILSLIISYFLSEFHFHFVNIVKDIYPMQANCWFIQCHKQFVKFFITRRPKLVGRKIINIMSILTICDRLLMIMTLLTSLTRSCITCRLLSHTHTWNSNVSQNFNFT